jgi:spore coat polysaccharide biosynthesis protein SpsF
MSSSRLRGKVLMPLNNNLPVLHYLCERVAQVDLASGFMIATSNDVTDDPIQDFCINNSIQYIRGSLDNVASRYAKAIELFQPSAIIRITADCPLLDPTIINQMIINFNENGYDYYSNVCPSTFPNGFDVEIIKAASYLDSYYKTSDKLELEHVTLNIRRNLKNYYHSNFYNDFDDSSTRLTLDYYEDFLLIKEIYSSLYGDKKIFTYRDIQIFLNKNPQLLNLNKKYLLNE